MQSGLKPRGELAFPVPGERAGRVQGALAALGRTLQMLKVLTKFNIGFLSTFSAATGYILAAHGVGWPLVPAILGTLLLALGAAAMNEVQEWRIDSVMKRTQHRPIPTGQITPGAGLAVALSLLALGYLALLVFISLAAAALGILAVVSYNLFYTYLKRVTAFAVVPGSIIGAIPPAIGWVAAGGSLADPRVLALSFFFFMWQIPHFWLLLFLYGDDYARAGLPTLTKIFSREQLGRLTFIWMVTTAVSCLLLPFFGVIRMPLVDAGLVGAAAWLVFNAVKILKAGGERRRFGLAFRDINLYALLVMGLLVLDAVI
jgi:heme o synthase